MQKIPLFSRAGEIRDWALVDDEDWEDLHWQPWCLHNQGYAVRTVRVENYAQMREAGRRYRKTVHVRMHRQIMGLEPGDPREVDHIDRNRLNNQRYNLRIATDALQLQNHGPQGTSGYRGVTWSKKREKWQAQCQIDGKYHFLGYFESKEEAAAVASAFRLQNMPFATS